jgi:hypothetical protein
VSPGVTDAGMVDVNMKTQNEGPTDIPESYWAMHPIMTD